MRAQFEYPKARNNPRRWCIACNRRSDSPARCIQSSRVRTHGIVYRRLKMRKHSLRVRLPVQTGIGTSILLPLPRSPLLRWLLQSSLELALLTTARLEQRPAGLLHGPRFRDGLPQRNELTAAWPKRGIKCAMGRQATCGSPTTVVDPSCHSRSRTRTRALDPVPPVTAVEIERPAHSQGRGRYNRPSRPNFRSIPAQPGSGSANQLRWNLRDVTDGGGGSEGMSGGDVVFSADERKRTVIGLLCAGVLGTLKGGLG